VYSMACYLIRSGIEINMYISPDGEVTLASFVPDDLTSKSQDEGEKFKPVEERPATTLPIDPGLSDDITPTSDRIPQTKFEPPMPTESPPISADSTPLQIWEGSVIEVDHAARVMHVVLDAKLGEMPTHTGEIELEWVSEQDQDLVYPGAVFYLTLFKRTKRGGSIEKAQELRFRRRPSWSTAQLKQIDVEAGTLLSKMKPRPRSG
jgi:hypothetical protein